MRKSYLYILIAIVVSCKSAPDLKSYGVIASTVGEIPTIDTSNCVVKPVTYQVAGYTLNNKSTNQKINFVCKAYFNILSSCPQNWSNIDTLLLEHTEKHVVAPKGEIKLDMDSTSNYRIIKYEVIEATSVAE